MKLCLHSVIAKRRTFLWIIVTCFYSSALHAASQPLLWQVQDKDSRVRLYLFGSLHYGDEAFYPLPDAVLQAHRDSDVLAVELDIDALDGEKVRAALKQYGYYPGEKNLQTQLGEKMWKTLTQVSENLGGDAQQLKQFKPWLAALQLTNMQLARSDYQQTLGLDKYFLTASRDKKIILELESLDEQMQLFNQLSDAEQVEFLQVTLNEQGKAEESLKRLADAWYQGDEPTLNELVFRSFRQRKLGHRLYQFIFVERNKQMLKTIDAYMKKAQKIFLVVGIGHMLGEDGLVALFQAQGYQVTLVTGVTTEVNMGVNAAVNTGRDD